MKPLTPSQCFALALACDTRGVTCDKRTARILAEHGYATHRPAFYGGTEVNPTPAGRDYITSLGGPREVMRSKT